MPHSLTLGVRVDRPHTPVSGGLVHVLVQLQAPEPDQRSGNQRLPLNLAAVLDRSGSMDGAKLDHTKRAAAFLVDQLLAIDRLAVVTYDNAVDTLFPSQPVVDKGLLKGRIDAVASGGSTNLSGGLATGMQQIDIAAGPDCLSRTLLLTDGLANMGVTDPATLISWAKAWRERGLGLSTLGVGADFNEDLLVALAEAGGGNFHFIANPDQLPAVFATELAGLLQVVAQGLQLRLETEPGVAVDAILGYPPTGTPTAVVMTLPDLYGGETKAVLFRLAVAAPPASGRLARLSLDYLPATAGAEPMTLTSEIAVSVTADDHLLTAPPDEEVTRQVRLTEASTARDEAVGYSDRGDHASAARRLSLAADELSLLAESDVYAADQVARLRHEAELLTSGDHAQTRKEIRHQQHQARQGRPQPR